MTPNTPLTPSEPTATDENNAKTANRTTESTRYEVLGGGTEVQRPEYRTIEGRTTASETHSCEHCGEVLTGRKERFCSDRCRMKARRAKQQERVNELLTTIETAVSALRVELEGHRDEA
jgi:uncharacterized protein with Zn-ribbon domain DUF2116